MAVQIALSTHPAVIILFDSLHSAVRKFSVRNRDPEPLPFFHNVTDGFFNLSLDCGRRLFRARARIVNAP
jgi:hypothetical protein